MFIVAGILGAEPIGELGNNSFKVIHQGQIAGFMVQKMKLTLSLLLPFFSSATKLVRRDLSGYPGARSSFWNNLNFIMNDTCEI